MKSKGFKRKMSNILLLGILIAIVMGIYYNVYNSRAEKVLEVTTIALDNYGYVENEEFALEATHIGNNIYEIELPEVINGKKVVEISSATLEDLEEKADMISTAATVKKAVAAADTKQVETPNGEQPEGTVQTSDEEEPEGTVQTPNEEQPEGTVQTSDEEEPEGTVQTPNEKQPEDEAQTPNEEEPEGIVETPNEGTSTEKEQNVENSNENTSTPLEIKDNKITLSKMDLLDKKIKLEVTYDVALIKRTEDGVYQRLPLSEMTDEERENLKGTDAEIVYKKTLKYKKEITTDSGTETKSVELTGYLPQKAQLKIEETQQEKLTEIFGKGQIDVAYDIKIVVETRKQVLVDETNPAGEMKEVIETTAINPEDFGETCEVAIKDANILENSQVYHVKEDNTYEMVMVKENAEKTIKFDVYNFSIYAISTDKEVALEATPTIGIGTDITAYKGYYAIADLLEDPSATSEKYTATINSSIEPTSVTYVWSGATYNTGNAEPISSFTTGQYRYNIPAPSAEINPSSSTLTLKVTATISRNKLYCNKSV